MPKTAMHPSPTQAPRTRSKRSTWGGRRPGAGRKRSFKKNQDVPHEKRPAFEDLSVFHVTLRMIPRLPTLRAHEPANAIANIFAHAVHEDRLAPVHWSIQTNHLHMVLEVDSTTVLARGMHSLTVRIAKALNKAWKRKGTVFARRYYARPVVGPRETRNVIRYVLLNRKRHGSRLDAVDPYSSGRWFDGWSTPPPPAPPGPKPAAEARSCLLKEFWRFFFQPIDVHEQPVGPPRFDPRHDALLD